MDYIVSFHVGCDSYHNYGMLSPYTEPGEAMEPKQCQLMLENELYLTVISAVIIVETYVIY